MPGFRVLGVPETPTLAIAGRAYSGLRSIDLFLVYFLCKRPPPPLEKGD